LTGGYDDGYSSCPCFWGQTPGSLVRDFLRQNPSLTGRTVLDLGCGEEKTQVRLLSLERRSMQSIVLNLLSLTANVHLEFLISIG
jgi:hypothetical protein